MPFLYMKPSKMNRFIMVWYFPNLIHFDWKQQKKNSTVLHLIGFKCPSYEPWYTYGRVGWAGWLQPKKVHQEQAFFSLSELSCR
jgi:hypothetical protein